jgi:hypothetical protein
LDLQDIVLIYIDLYWFVLIHQAVFFVVGVLAGIVVPGALAYIIQLP